MKLKKWLYALRTCLAAEWAAEFREKPPMRLADLADGLVTDADLRAHIDAVIAAKAGLAESADVAMFDEFFRQWLGRAWSKAG